MTERMTQALLESAVGAVNDKLHDAGLMHADAHLFVGGRYGRTYVEITGGPLFTNGSTETLVSGTKRECADAMHAISRAFHLGWMSKGDGRWTS